MVRKHYWCFISVFSVYKSPEIRCSRDHFQEFLKYIYISEIIVYLSCQISFWWQKYEVVVWYGKILLLNDTWDISLYAYLISYLFSLCKFCFRKVKHHLVIGRAKWELLKTNWIFKCSHGNYALGMILCNPASTSFFMEWITYAWEIFAKTWLESPVK